MISHSKDCQTIELEYKSFMTATIFYCKECFKYEYGDVFCEHDYTPIKLIISNGAIQIRLYCRKCNLLSSKSEPHSKYDLSTLPEKRMEDYQKFYNEFQDSEYEIIHNFTNYLTGMANAYNQKGYAEYLQTDWWKKIRQQALDRDKNMCQICNANAECVHHLTYAHRCEEYLFELVSLCNKCHESYHINEQ